MIILFQPSDEAIGMDLKTNWKDWGSSNIYSWDDGFDSLNEYFSRKVRRPVKVDFPTFFLVHLMVVHKF